MSIGNSYNSFNMEQYLKHINSNDNNTNTKDINTTQTEDGNNNKAEQIQTAFDFKSAFEIYGDSENVINDDVLSEVITGLSNALEIDTIRNIDKFIESIDLSKVSDDSVVKTKEAIKSVLSNIASSYGLSNSLELSSSDFASFSVVSNIMFKSGKSDIGTREKLSSVMSNVILGSNGNINSILSQVSEILGTDEHNDYIGAMLDNIANLNSTGSPDVIARRDMWEFGKQTLKNYSQRIEIKKEVASATANETETVNKNAKSLTDTLNSQLISGGETKYILDKIMVKQQSQDIQKVTPELLMNSIYDAMAITENPIDVIFNKPKIETDLTGRIIRLYPDGSKANNYYEIEYNDNDGSFTVISYDNEGKNFRQRYLIKTVNLYQTQKDTQ